VARDYFIQVKFTDKQAQHLLNLIEDELDICASDAVDRKALEASAALIKSGLQRLDARLERLAE
jgi:hypothetical protein